MAHTALRIHNVSLVAGNEVDMHMKDALPGCRPHIHADVVSIRSEFFVYPFLFFLDQAHAGRDLGWSQFKEAGDMPTRNNQGMARADWIGVAGAIGKLMLQRYPAWILAEQAGIVWVSFFLLCCFRHQQSTFSITLYFRCDLTHEEIILASNQARAYFALLGYHFNPDDITHQLGIEPTSVNAAGAYSGLDKPVISSWELSTEISAGDVDVFALTDSLVKQLNPFKEKIIEVCQSHNLSPRLGVVLTLSTDKTEPAPEVGFSVRTIRFLADMGAFIEVENKLSAQL